MSWIYTWIYDALRYLGLISHPRIVLLLGLDNAGKTTLLHFVEDRYLPEPRSILKELRLEGVQFLKFDLGGMPYPGHRWHEHTQDIHGIIFMVDDADHSRMEEARSSLKEILTNERVAAVPIVVLANKIDRPEALLEADLERAINVKQFRTGKGTGLPKHRPFEVFMCSVMKRQGYIQGLKWIAQYI